MGNLAHVRKTSWPCLVIINVVLCACEQTLKLSEAQQELQFHKDLVSSSGARQPCPAQTHTHTHKETYKEAYKDTYKSVIPP